MAFGYLLLVLIPVLAIVYIIWDHKRKAAQRAAASAGRLDEIIGSLAPAPGVQRDARGPQEIASSGTPSAAPLYVARERLLSPVQTLLYFLLRTGLPDYVIFAHVPLASVLDAGPGLSGLARDETLQRFAAQSVDFVVSDRRMRPVAAIAIATGASGSARGMQASPRAYLEAAGVRYLELDAAALPKKDAIRALVLGEAAAAEHGRVSAEQTAG